MTWKEAVRYCEEHECKDCVVYNIPDCRTEYERTMLHAPCCANLVDEDLRYFYGASSFTEEEKFLRRRMLEENSKQTSINIFNL